MKKYILISMLFILAISINAQTYLQENFDVDIPADWIVTDEGGAMGDSWVSGLQGGANSLNGSNVAFVDSDANGDGIALIETLTSPVFDTTGSVLLYLDFDQYYNNNGAADFTIVEVFDGTNWVEVLNQAADIGAFDAPDTQHLDITAYSNAAMQIRFVYNDGDTWAWYWLLDNIIVYNSTCDYPSGFIVDNITDVSADLTWSTGGSESNWEVLVQAAGTGEPTGSGTATMINNSYPISGLTAITDYEVWVRSDCGVDGFSFWSGPINFSTFNTPPPAPVGVTCSTGSSSYVYTAEFDGLDGWTGDFGGADGTWEIPNDSGSFGTGADAAFSGTSFMNYEAGTSTTTASAVSPAIDLTSAVDGAELSFYMHAFGSDMGVLNVGVSDSAAGPFTNLFIWSGELQTDGAQPWVPIGINLDSYLGQTIYVEFSHTGIGGFEGDMSIDLVRVEACGSFCIAPSSIVVSNVGGTTADIDWNGNNGETSWEYVVLPAGSGEPTGSGTTVGSTTVNETGLDYSTDYEVWLRADCGSGVFSSWAGPINFTTTIQTEFAIDCTQAPTQINYCYLNNDTTNWTFTSSDGSPIRIVFNSGTIEGGFDDLSIYDGTDNTGALLFSSEGDDVFDFTGLTFDSVLGDSIYMEVNSDGSVSCESGARLEWDFIVSCATCVNPVATYSVVSNCVVGPEFFVEVDLTDLGSANTITLSDDQGSAPQTVGVTGVVTFGPFANNVPVVITVANDDDTNCEISSGALTQELCLDTVVDCSAGPIAGFLCYDNNDSITLTYTSSDGSPLNLTINSGEVEGDPFDFLLVTDGSGTPAGVLYNGEGNDGDISGLTFQSLTGVITIQVTSDGSVSCTSGSFPDGIDFTVACATCINPVATYQVVDDCANGNQFLIDVNVTSLGDATSLTISNNIDGLTEPVSATGIYQIGPFPFLVDVVVTINNDQDVNCVINSSAIQLLACPPENDNPCNATMAVVNADVSCDLITSGTLLEATPSGVPDGACAGDPDDDVWFEFVALNDIQIISILNINGGGFFQDIDHAVYEGTCGAPVELYCSDANASVTPVLTIGNTYYVRIFSADSDSVDYTFDLCIRPGSGNVLVDQTTYTPEELVIDVLIDSPCAQISNVTFSTGTNFGEDNGIGYFSNPDGGFPFEEGLLLTSGDASQAAGPNVNFVSSGTGAWTGDADLTAITGEVTNNATIIEFDFVPLNDELSFDFLMASEEYDMGTFECDYSDAFAFLLTDSNSVTTNLAVVPGTTDPILVTNIHPDNGACPAINEQYFGEYIPDNLPPISFDGRTDVFTAFSPVNIGEVYHIKLVIADARDNAFDSGVYLKAGSFDIGEVDLGGDITIAGGTAVCEDETIILDTSAPNVDHVWYKDGFVIPGEIASTLTVIEAGLYTVQIIFSPSCIIDDEVLIEFLPKPVVANTPDDLTACSTTNQAEFDIYDNTNVVLGVQSPTDFTVTYHESQAEADLDINNLMSPYPNTSNPQTIYIRIEDNATGCFETTNFELSISSPTHTAESVDLIGCDNDDDGIATFDLVTNDIHILNGQDASQFIVTYHTSQADAMDAIGALTSPYDSSGETIFVRVETLAFADCYVTNSFDLVIGTEPLTSFTTNFDYEVCPNATVPIIIAATPENYTESEVTINWYLENGLISNENGLTLPVIDAGDYEIEVIFNDTGCSNSTFITVIELPTCVIPQGISPNGDGKNEVFDLSSYGVTKLEIFNRNGVLVYTKKNYTNEWFGQTNEGDELPVGTYFYTMEYDNGKQRVAWVYIQREN
ncbi:choice-of-anchor L domain-containing protein [Psychroserpens ponticola]|uniref:Choice-of-anchor L domain-containing protein n=1 Tax=Psychroserpens ponticola TaxID=2932268 RepID=A0ABY7S0T3_9FLAO|nr:choice-of-anchor L domain-containing protein [Psychroserpens ponticola]WCO01530.1 choice-of-anchor L domain-containing protein [Psychroserpens ponticola]